jgi:hypothetical protein
MDDKDFEAIYREYNQIIPFEQILRKTKLHEMQIQARKAAERIKLHIQNTPQRSKTLKSGSDTQNISILAKEIVAKFVKEGGGKRSGNDTSNNPFTTALLNTENGALNNVPKSEWIPVVIDLLRSDEFQIDILHPGICDAIENELKQQVPELILNQT